MKKSIKYVVVLCMLVAMMIPTMAFAAENNCDQSQNGFKVNAGQIQNLCAKYMPNLTKGFDLQTLKETCGKLDYVQNCTDWSFRKVACNQPEPPSAPASPVKFEKPTTPAADVEPDTATPVTNAKATTPEKPVAPAGNNGSAASYEAQVVDLVNKERAAQGLSALKYNAELSKVAEAKAEDLRDKNYFSHTSPTYGSPFDMMKSFGIRYTAAGENIAKGYMSPSSVMNGWMNSPGHKANIMNSNFTEIGVGYVSGENGTGYWVQMFIRP